MINGAVFWDFIKMNNYYYLIGLYNVKVWYIKWNIYYVLYEYCSTVRVCYCNNSSSSSGVVSLPIHKILYSSSIVRAAA